MEQLRKRQIALEKKLQEKDLAIKRQAKEVREQVMLQKKHEREEKKKNDTATKLLIIMEVAQHPCIFDKTHPTYKKRNLLDAAWRKIENSTAVSGANHIWNQVKAAARKKANTWRPSGSGLDDCELDGDEDEAVAAARILLDSTPQQAETDGSCAVQGQQRPAVKFYSQRSKEKKT